MAKAAQQEKIVQAVVQQLAQGVQPKELMKSLTDKGMPPEQASKLVQAGISYVEQKTSQPQMTAAEKYAQSYSGGNQLPQYEYGSVVNQIANSPQLMNVAMQVMPSLANQVRPQQKAHGGMSGLKTVKKNPKANYKQGGLSKFLPKAQFGNQGEGMPFAEGYGMYEFNTEDPNNLNEFDGSMINTSGPRNEMDMTPTQDEMGAQIVQDKHDVAMGTSFPNFEQVEPTQENIAAAESGELGMNQPGYELNQEEGTGAGEDLDLKKLKPGQGAVSDPQDVKRERFWWETAPVKNTTLKTLQGLANMTIGAMGAAEDVSEFVAARKAQKQGAKYGGKTIPKYQDGASGIVGGGMNTATMDMNQFGQEVDMTNMIGGSSDIYDIPDVTDPNVTDLQDDVADDLVTIDESETEAFDAPEKIEAPEEEKEDTMKTKAGTGSSSGDEGLDPATQFLVGAEQLLDARDEKKKRREHRERKTRAAGNTMGYMSSASVTPQNPHGVKLTNPGMGPMVAPKLHYQAQDLGYGQGFIAKEGGTMNLQKLFKFVGGGQMPKYQGAGMVEEFPQEFPQNQTPDATYSFTNPEVVSEFNEPDIAARLKHQDFVKQYAKDAGLSPEETAQLVWEQDQLLMSKSYADTDPYEKRWGGMKKRKYQDAGTVDQPMYVVTNPEMLDQGMDTPFYGTEQDYNSMLMRIRGWDGDLNAPLTPAEAARMQRMLPIHQEVTNRDGTTKVLKHYKEYPVNVKPGVIEDMIQEESKTWQQQKDLEKAEAERQGLNQYQDAGVTAESTVENANPDFVNIEGDRYAPKKFVNRKGELKKGVKWVDNPNLDKEWFINDEGERVYAYNATAMGMDADDPNAWNPYYEQNEGPMQYQRKVGWALRDVFNPNKGPSFQDGGMSNLQEGQIVEMTPAQIRAYEQMGGVVEIVR